MVVPKETWFGRPLAVTHRLWTADRRDELPHSLFPIHNDASHLTSITFRNCLTRRYIPIPFLSSFDWRRTTVAFAQFASFNPSEFSFRTHSPLNLAQRVNILRCHPCDVPSTPHLFWIPSPSTRLSKTYCAKFRELSLNFPKLADWLCMGRPSCPAALRQTQEDNSFADPLNMGH